MSAQRPLAPDFELSAVVSGRKISRAACAGRPLLLLFHDQDGLSMVKSLQEAVRSRWPHSDQVLVASVVNMQSIPSFLRSVAEKMMGLVFRDAARQIPAGFDPTDYVLILPDRSGRVSIALGIFDGGKSPCGVVLDAQWQICARISGGDLPAQALVALEPLIPHS